MTLKIERRHLRKICINYDLFGVLRYVLYMLVYLVHFLKYICITLINRNKIIILITKKIKTFPMSMLLLQIYVCTHQYIQRWLISVGVKSNCLKVGQIQN